MNKSTVKIPAVPSTVPSYVKQLNGKKIKKGGCGCGGKKVR
ncbi:hypothetical protein [Heyndrickxia ginsengihumi]|nr:hypothetical protein [Heyndrickxia ginsengihumi]